MVRTIKEVRWSTSVNCKRIIIFIKDINNQIKIRIRYDCVKIVLLVKKVFERQPRLKENINIPLLLYYKKGVPFRQLIRFLYSSK